MAEQRYHFEPGEQRFIWLDEDDERTSPYHLTVAAAYRYRAALLRHLGGDRVWSSASRSVFEPQGTGKSPARLAKVVMELQEQPLTDDEQLDAAAAERLAAPRPATSTRA